MFVSMRMLLNLMLHYLNPLLSDAETSMLRIALPVLCKED